MRWEFVKAATQLAKEALGRQAWVEVPPRLASEGVLNARIAGKAETDIPLEYKVTSDGNSMHVHLILGGHEKSFSLPRRSALDFKVACQNPSPLACVIRRYGGSAPEALAALASSEGCRNDDALTTWGRKNRLSKSVIAGVKQELIKQGEFYSPLRHSPAEAAKQKFEPRDRVRVVAPDMEYGEAAWVIGRRKPKGGPVLYLVLVDGSSEPREYSQEHLRPLGAGRVG